MNWKVSDIIMADTGYRNNLLLSKWNCRQMKRKAKSEGERERERGREETVCERERRGRRQSERERETETEIVKERKGVGGGGVLRFERPVNRTGSLRTKKHYFK